MTFLRFTIEHSDSEFYPPTPELPSVGLTVNRYTTLNSWVAKAAPCQGLATADVLHC